MDGLTGDQRYRTASGTIVLRDVSGQVAVDAVSGDVSIAPTGDSAIGARTVSGDLHLQAGTVRSLRISTTSGDMRIEGRLAGDGPFAIESVSGDTILAPVGGITVTVKSVTGDIRSDLESTTEGNRGSRTVTVGDGGAAPDAPVDLRRPAAGPALRAGSSCRRRHPSCHCRRSRPNRPRRRPRPNRRVPPRRPPSRSRRPPRRTARAETDDPDGDEPAPATDPSLAILEALERGEIDVAEATRRLAALDAEARS